MPRPLPALALAALAAALAGCPSEPDRSCPSGQERCQGFCVDVASYATDPASCGGCGIACGSGTCAGGVCQCEGLTRCDGAIPRCADLATDPANCGGCGSPCPKANAACVGGGCACVAPLSDECPAACTDFQTDEANCGGCGAPCTKTNEQCLSGVCACPPALPDTCGAACVNQQTDEANCGTCGRACARANESCVAGSCACPGALPDACPGACVALSSDEANCGTCGNRCATGATCDAGACGCAPDRPLVCGSAPGSCCAGTGCCGTACQTEHENGIGIPGLGQRFYDCRPRGTYDATQAEAAARAWRPAGTRVNDPELLCQGCVGWRDGSAACAVWCYGTGPSDPLRGRVGLNTLSAVCVCPSAGTPNWN